MSRQAKPRVARSGPMLRDQTSSLFWSGLACSGCMEATAPRAAKRGASAASIASTCSTRSRRSRGPFCFAAAAKASRAMRIPRSPMEWSHTCRPALSAAATARSRAACSQRGVPRPRAGSSDYGASIAAVCASITPST